MEKKKIGVLFLFYYFSLAAVLCKPESMYTQSDNAGVFVFQVKKEDFINHSVFILFVQDSNLLFI